MVSQGSQQTGLFFCLNKTHNTHLETCTINSNLRITAFKISSCLGCSAGKVC